MSPNDADGMANSVDTDQSAPLIWVCTVCPGISVRKLRITTVKYFICFQTNCNLKWPEESKTNYGNKLLLFQVLLSENSSEIAPNKLKAFIRKICYELQDQCLIANFDFFDLVNVALMMLQILIKISIMY